MNIISFIEPQEKEAISNFHAALFLCGGMVSILLV
jgi:hypothetical protein